MKGKDLVSKVTVIFPQQKSWPLLSSNYYNLKEMLTEKYGKPFKIVEKFDITSKPENDDDRMRAVILDKCKFNTTYELENGSIQISIEHNRFMGGFVMLTYLDKINSEILRQKAIDDL